MPEYPWKIKWDKRSEFISRYITDKMSVIDVGGGLGNLLNYINPFRYQSIDLEAWTDHTVVADLNVKFPKLDKADYVVCQGIMEYMFNVEDFLQGVKQYGDVMILTYRLKSGRQVMKRNDYQFQDISEFLIDNGWKVLIEKSVNPLEKFYFCIKI